MKGLKPRKGLSTTGNIIWKQYFSNASQQFPNCFETVGKHLGNTVFCPGLNLNCRQDACELGGGCSSTHGKAKSSFYYLHRLYPKMLGMNEGTQ